jgi:hypothetical protein
MGGAAVSAVGLRGGTVRPADAEEPAGVAVA